MFCETRVDLRPLLVGNGGCDVTGFEPEGADGAGTAACSPSMVAMVRSDTSSPHEEQKRLVSETSEEHLGQRMNPMLQHKGSVAPEI
jgi:hypothetical protein